MKVTPVRPEQGLLRTCLPPCPTQEPEAGRGQWLTYSDIRSSGLALEIRGCGGPLLSAYTPALSLLCEPLEQVLPSVPLGSPSGIASLPQAQPHTALVLPSGVTGPHLLAQRTHLQLCSH